MLKRKIMEELIRWKNRPGKTPLIVQGLRQIGKTTLALEFANIHYENAFYVDFRKQKSAHAIFDGDFDIDSIMFSLSVLPRDKRLKNGNHAIPGKTLVIFDEIQDCPNARSSLKYFKDDGRFDVLATGSLLGVKGYRQSKKPSRGIGVGSEELLTMHPMDFEEFVYACNPNDMIWDKLRECLLANKAIPGAIHAQLSELYKRYLIIGGMPEVVEQYIRTHDYPACRKIQQRIIQNYKMDFGTHLNDDLQLKTDDHEKALISEVFRSIPKQLSKKNAKFQYSFIRHGGDARTFGFALTYLEDYGLIQRADNLTALEAPLDYFVAEGQFKIYLSDAGLFMAMLEEEVPSMLLSDALGMGKGMIYENMFAETASKQGRKLFYYKKDSGLEVDFIDIVGSEISLIEIKAKNGNTKSSNTIVNNPSSKAKRIVRITSSNIARNGAILTIPHYMTSLLWDYQWEKDNAKADPFAAF